MERTEILTIDEAKALIRSKQHFILKMGILGGYLLPPKNEITWRFIQQILRKEKRLVRVREVKIGVELPRIRQFSVTRLWPQLQNDGRILDYFPDYKPGKFPRRDFFFKIIATVFPEEFERLVTSARDERQQQEINQTLIQVDDEIIAELRSHNNQFDYLKQKDKVHYLNNRRRWRAWPEMNNNQ